MSNIIINKDILEKIRQDIRCLAQKYNYIHNIDIDLDDFTDEQYDMKKYIELCCDYYPRDIYVSVGQCKILCDESIYYHMEERAFGVSYLKEGHGKYEIFLKEIENIINKCDKLIKYYK